MLRLNTSDGRIIESPPPNYYPLQAAHACKRCHVRKRKCDRKRPRCSACIAANSICEFELKSGDREVNQQINQFLAKIRTLEERVIWLQQIIVAADSSLANISAIATGQCVTIQPQETVEHLVGPAAHAPQSTSTHLAAPGFIDVSTSITASLLNLEYSTQLLQDHDASPAARSSTSPSARSSTSSPIVLPSIDLAIDACKKFISGHKQAHHIVDEEELLQDLQNVYQPGGLTDPRLFQSRFRCFMVLSLAQSRHWEGQVTEEQDSTSNRMYHRLAFKEAGLAVARHDLESVQAMGLLALMSIQEQQLGIDLWQVVGLAARTSLALGIHRQDNVYLPGVASAFTNGEQLDLHNERRKNIFWAIYSLDRLVTFTLMRPAALRDEYIDVELPTLPPPSSAMECRDVPDVAVRNHSVEGRKLYGRIFHSLYAVSVTSEDQNTKERESIINKYTSEVQAWYAASPLKAAFMAITEATIRRQSVTDLQYHQMIMALHRPSPLMPRIPSSFIDILHESASISIGLYRHYSERNQVLVNWIHFHQIFTSCTTLVFCFCEYQARDDLSALPREQVLARIEQCKQLIAQFGTKTPQRQNLQSMFDILTQSFSQPQLGASTSAAIRIPDSNFEEASVLGDFAPAAGELGSQGMDGFLTDFWNFSSPSTVMQGFWPESWTVSEPGHDVEL